MEGTEIVVVSGRSANDARLQSRATVDRVKERISEIIKIKTAIDKKVPDIVHSTQSVADLVTYELMANMLEIMDLPNIETSIEVDIEGRPVLDQYGNQIETKAPNYKNLVMKIQAGGVIGKIQQVLKDRIKEEEREDSKVPTVVFSQEHEIRTADGTVKRTRTTKTSLRQTEDVELIEDYGEETDTDERPLYTST
jgi:hypothetical protein